VRRFVATIIAISAMLAFAIIQTGSVAATDNQKWFVCKYVGTPGVDERLQTGDNPVSVGNGGVPQPVPVGQFFQDGQGRSYILVEDTGQPEPPVTDCPPPDSGPPPTPTPPGPTPTPVEPTPTPVEPTPTPPGATPTPVEPTPTPGIGEFSVEVAPCPLREGGTVNLLGYIPPVVFGAVIPEGQSGIRFIGILLLLHVRIDGLEVTPDSEGDVIVTPGLHEWSISNAADTEVLASGELFCPECNALAVPTPTPTDTPPSSDVADGQPGGGNPNLVLLLILLGAGAAGAVVLTGRKGTR